MIVFIGGMLFSCLYFVRATPVAYGSSWAGVESELQLPVYSTATASLDPSHVCDLHHSSWQQWILNPLSKARDQTCNLMDINWTPNQLSHSRNFCFFPLNEPTHLYKLHGFMCSESYTFARLICDFKEILGKI